MLKEITAVVLPDRMCLLALIQIEGIAAKYVTFER